MEEAWSSTTQYLEISGLGIGEPILGLTVIQILLVGARDRIVTEPTRHKDMHQQQQKQQNPPKPR
jgi:hypothetical protein